MKSKPLIETNPYLKDPAMRERLVKRSVITSCGVEGIIVADQTLSTIKILKRKDKKIYTRLKKY